MNIFKLIMGNKQTGQLACGPKGPSCHSNELNMICSNTFQVGTCICLPGFTKSEPTSGGGRKRGKRMTYRGCMYDSFCVKDQDCHMIWGRNSRCSGESSKRKCECFDNGSNGKRETFMENGQCAVKKTDNPAEEIIKCQPKHVWYNPLKKCLPSDHCMVTEECKESEFTESILFPECNFETGRCECQQGGGSGGEASWVERVYDEQLKKCFRKRAYNYPCDSDDECRVSLGREVKCRYEDMERKCLCPEGTLPEIGRHPIHCIKEETIKSTTWPDHRPPGSNYTGSYNESFPNSTMKSSGRSALSITLLSGLGIVAVIVLAILAFFIIRKRFFRRDQPLRKDIEMKQSSATENEYGHLLKEASFEKICSDLSIKIYGADEIIDLVKIGQGYFGTVYKGKLEGKTVAIKMFRNEHSPDAIQEMETMANFDHPNILHLLGVAKSEDSGSPWLLVEFMEHGDLASVLRNDNFRPGSVQGLHRSPSALIAGNENKVDSLKNSEEDYQNAEPFKLTPDILLNIANQIADGMAYLAHNRFVHRDLAARNCLVSGNGSVKISDFGLSRDVYSSDYYKTGGSKLLPVRWMSPESIFYGRFTLESDVWAYGIVLWEIYTWGKQPYFGHSNEEVIKLVTDGVLLNPPNDCPPFIHGLMAGCWKTEPNDRLTFSKISEKFANARRISERQMVEEAAYEDPVKVAQPEYFQVV